MRISFINIIIIINNKYVKTKTNIIILYEIIFHFQNSINVHHVKGMEYNDNDNDNDEEALILISNTVSIIHVYNQSSLSTATLSC